MIARAACAVLAAAALALAPSGAAADEPKVRGVILSTHGSGRDWGEDTLGATFEEIRALGAGWVAIHPYAGIEADGTVRSRPLDPDRPPAHLRRPIEEAHRLGLKILIMPHLAEWGSPFPSKGEIGFTTPAEWARFFATYEAWIVGLARACRGADGFVVGTELDRTIEHEADWRRIIRQVRGTSGAALTYAANWSEYRRVSFWDALDVIGIQAYFPLTERPTADPAPIEAGWARRMAELGPYAASQNRKVVFTELGYNRSFQAPVAPWAYEVDGPEAEGVQETCLRAALGAVEAEPAVVGVFLWKWFPNPRPVGRNFQLATPRLRRAIADAWRGEGSSP